MVSHDSPLADRVPRGGSDWRLVRHGAVLPGGCQLVGSHSGRLPLGSHRDARGDVLLHGSDDDGGIICVTVVDCFSEIVAKKA